MSSSATNRKVDTNIVNSDALDHYVYAVTVCNSLALLASQESSREFTARMALLTALQKCWKNGHSVLNFVCSCDGLVDLFSNVVERGDLSSITAGDDDKSRLDLNIVKHLQYSRRNSEALSDDSAGGSNDEYVSASVSLETESVFATAAVKCEFRETEMGKSGDDCEESLPTMSQHQLHTENNCDNDKTNSSHKKHHHPVDSCTSTAFGNLESTLDSAKSTYTVCQICCRRLANAKTLARHLQRVHNIEPAPIKSDTLSVATGSEDILADISDSGDGKGDQQAKWGVICSVCGRQFRYRYLLASHSVTHTGERPAACRFPGCGKRFGQTSTRNYHERTHSQARPYICSTCGRCFKQQTILRTHIATIHGSGARPYSCEQCGKSFKLCGALQTHQKTVHSDARPHPCPECPKSFRYLHRLLRHQRALHSDVRPYHCSVCDKTFSQPGNLRTHMRTHTGERPYLCKVCGQSFAHSGTLKGHMSTHQHSSPPALSLATSTTTHLTNNTSLPSFVAN